MKKNKKKIYKIDLNKTVKTEELARVSLGMKKVGKSKTSKIAKYGRNSRALSQRTKLVNKSGKLNFEAIAKTASKWKLDYDEVKRAVLQTKRAGESMNVAKLLSQLSTNKVERFLSNFGVSVEEVLTRINVIAPTITKAQVLDETNWYNENGMPSTDYKLGNVLEIIAADGSTVKCNFEWDYNQGAWFDVETSFTPVEA